MWTTRLWPTRNSPAAAGCSPRGTFELSQAYLAFYNKLERSNWFLDHIVATADKGLDDREVTWLVNAPMQDGGDWDMVCGLIEKYGVVPHAAMVETACTNDTAQINTVLSHLLRQDALKLRSMVREGAADADVEAAEEAMLTEVYRVLCVAFGEPPQKVDFEYTDSKKEFHGVYGLTPLEFYRRYVGIDLDDYVGVINVPGEGNPYGRTYAIEDSDQVPERENLYLNVDMPTLKAAVIDQLKAGEPVWFGCDVLQHCDEQLGVMIPDRELLGHRGPRQEGGPQRLLRLQRRVVRRVRLRGGREEVVPLARAAEGPRGRAGRVALLEHLQPGHQPLVFVLRGGAGPLPLSIFERSSHVWTSPP